MRTENGGALIAFERNDRRARRLGELATEHARPLHPADILRLDSTLPVVAC